MLFVLSLVFCCVLLLPFKAEFETFLINLDKRPDKLKIAEYQLQQLGIRNYTRIPGIDGHKLYAELQANQSATVNSVLGVDYFNVSRENIRSHHAGKDGCTLSHMRVWKHIIDNNINTPVLIFEDDFLADSDAQWKLESIIPKLPSDWGIFYAGHCHYHDGTLVQSILGHQVRKITDPKVQVGCLHGYVVNGAEAAEKILKAGNTVQLARAADLFMEKAAVTRYALYPVLFSQIRTIIQSDAHSDGGFFGPMLNETLMHNVTRLMEETSNKKK